jgi:hypothetical protein
MASKTSSRKIVHAASRRSDNAAIFDPLPRVSVRLQGASPEFRGAVRAGLVRCALLLPTSPRGLPRNWAVPIDADEIVVATTPVAVGALTIRRTGARADYQCARFVKQGKTACPGIGRRRKLAVEQALASIVRPAIDGDIRKRALALVRAKLLTGNEVTSERDAVAAALQETEREGATLARAIAKGGKLESLLAAAKQNDDEKKRLRVRLAQLDASPTATLDRRRKLAEIERRLDELAHALDEGGIAARPAFAAVLQGRRLRVTPVMVDGERRWAISGHIPSGYVAELDEGVQRWGDSHETIPSVIVGRSPTIGGG